MSQGPRVPSSSVLAGGRDARVCLGEWVFVVENGKGARIVNLRTFAVLVWTRVEATP
jgi:hypothetical protein